MTTNDKAIEVVAEAIHIKFVGKRADWDLAGDSVKNTMRALAKAAIESYERVTPKESENDDD